MTDQATTTPEMEDLKPTMFFFLLYQLESATSHTRSGPQRILQRMQAPVAFLKIHTTTKQKIRKYHLIQYCLD